MEMNIKEAKEFLERKINKKDSAWEVRIYGELLEVLQHEEKFEKMWKEFKKWIGTQSLQNKELHKYWAKVSKGVNNGKSTYKIKKN